MAWLSNGIRSKSKWKDDPNSLLKESDFSTAQKSMRTEVINKTDSLRKKNLPIPGEGDDRNWLERFLNTPQNTGFLGDVLDVLSRGQYASANVAQKLTDGQPDSFGDILRAGGRGLSGEDRTSYRDVLEQAGMEQGPLRSTLGFVGDVLLDPTTYLTLGVGAGAKTGGKVAAKGLGKLPSLFGKEVIDKGGIKFMGASLVPGDVLEKGAEKAGLYKAGNYLRDTKPAQVLGKALIPNFREAGTDKAIWDSFVDTKKGYQNSLSYAQNKAVEDAIKMAKGYTPAERTLATHAIQDPVLYNAASDKVKKLADIANEAFNRSAATEHGLGLLKNPLPSNPLGANPGVLPPPPANYVPGIYPDKAKPFLQGIIKKDGIRATIGSHGKQKKFNTLQDAIDAGLKPETDIAKLVGQREVVSARATETQKFINEVIGKYGTKIKPDDIDKLDPSMGVYLPKGNLNLFPSGSVPQEFLDLVKDMAKDEMIEVPAGAIRGGVFASKNVPVFSLPKQIAGELNNFKKATIDEGSKGILGAYDKVLNLWKGYATAVNPGFHIRNAQSNAFQTALNDSKSLLNPLSHLKSTGVLLSDKNIPLAGSWLGRKTLDIGGKKMALPEVKELMKKEGVIDNGWIGGDIPKRIEQELDAGIRGKLSPQLLNPLSQQNALIKGGRAVGGLVENQARAFNFLNEAKKTGDVKQASKTVNKTLFDYGDVTPFEKNVLKRTIPFYTWMRKNIPLQAENIVRTPGKYAATKKAFDAVRSLSDPVNEKNLPEYMNNPNWVKIPFEQSGNPLYWNANLPTGDLDKVNPSQIGNTILGSLSPLLKTPLELKLNQNTFLNDKIEKYPGEMKKAPAYIPEIPEEIANALGAQYGLSKDEVEELQIPAKVRYVLQQVPFLENVSKTMDLQDDKKLNQILSFIMGAKVVPFDMKRAEMNALYDQRDALRAAYDKYQTQGVLESDEDLAKKKKSKSSTTKWLK